MYTSGFRARRIVKKAAIAGMAVLWVLTLLVALAPLHNV